MPTTAIIALVAALIGALAAGAINHFFRRYEAKLDRQKREKSAAYIYITKLARIPATVDLVKAQIAPNKGFFDDFVRSLKEKHQTEFEPAELVCAGIDVYLKDSTSEPLAPELTAQLEMLGDTLKHIEAFLAFRLSADQLASMPKSVAVEYAQFETALEGFFVGAAFVRRCLSGEATANAYTFFGCWIAAKRLYLTANDLIGALRRFGEISDDEYQAAYLGAALSHRLVSAETAAANARLGKIGEIVRSEIASRRSADNANPQT